MKLPLSKKDLSSLLLRKIRYSFIFFILCNFSHATPPQYAKNAHTSQNVRTLYDDLFYDYGFRAMSQELTWSWNWKEAKVQESNSVYGIPVHVMSGKSVSDDVIGQLPYYGYKMRGGYVTPDMNILVKKFRDTLFPIYKEWKKKSEELNLNGRASIELLLNFLQDVPYGLPPEKLNGRYIHGLFPPTAMFTQKYGDCDSKALAFASILSWDSTYKNKLAFITVPGHMLIGISDISRPYDQYVEHSGKKYIYVEPVGSNHSLFGKGNQDYRKIIAVEPLILEDEAPVTADRVNETNVDCPNDAFPVDYTSSFSGIRTLTCTKKLNGKYIKHGPQLIFSKSGKARERKIFRDDIEI